MQLRVEVDPPPDLHNNNKWRREGHQASHRKGYPQGIGEAGSLLSQEEQLDYHNNRTGAGRNDGYCTAFTLWR